MNKKKFQVIPQMFDIKPTNSAGDLDLEKITKIKRVCYLKKNKGKEKKAIIKKVVSSKWDIYFPSGKTEKLANFLKDNQQKKTIEKEQAQIIQSIKELEEKKRIIKNKQYQIEKDLSKKEINVSELRKKERELDYEEKQQKEILKAIEFKEAQLLEKKSQLIFEIEKAFVIPKEKSIAIKIQPKIEKKAYLKPENIEKSVLIEANPVYFSKNNFRKEDERILENESVRKMKECFSQYRASRLKKKKSANWKFWKNWNFNLQFQPVFSFALLLLFLVTGFFSIRLFFYGWQAKSEVAVKSKNAIVLSAQAQTDFKEKNFSQGLANLEMAQKQLQEASRQLEISGGNILGKIPFFSMINDSQKILAGGEKTLEAAQLIGRTVLTLYNQKGEVSEDKKISLRQVFQESEKNISEANELLLSVKKDFDKIDEENLPKEYQGYFEKVKITLDLSVEIVSQFEKNYQVFWQITGFDGPKKYLFLFQNNQELRATGGFIGSYGVLEMVDGQIKNFYIDDIYNPDGQLLEKVVPPQPIQKISATWSLHDSNWFPNFPTTAEKASWFFEKTGGPSVDGVIALTPEILLKILEITGPVEMPEYETTVDKDNFIERTQYEVEVDYDKELNRPKKFIADLAPKILNRLLSSQTEKNFLALAEVLSQSLKEKHLLLYSFDYNVQKMISELGFSGETLGSEKDYLMVINSNINGYKTDGVIEETIHHQAEIQKDGSIVDTVRIVRKHNGGKTDFEWWNKVNADYMRVYVPKGSQLLNVNGQTREFNSSPLDYDKLGFRRDPQVQKEELSIKVDEKSGTRIYEEDNKTVFANWVYVSPQETVEIEYQYVLPFKLDFSSNEGISSYALLAQKQSGTKGSKFLSEIFFTDERKVVWKYPDWAEILLDRISFSSDLKEDRFWAVVIK